MGAQGSGRLGFNLSHTAHELCDLEQVNYPLCDLVSLLIK